MSGLSKVVEGAGVEHHRELLAVALEEAARRVRMSCPDSFEVDVQDDVEYVDGSPCVVLLRRPLLRSFRIEW